MTYFRHTPLDRAKAAVAKFRASKRLSRKLATARGHLPGTKKAVEMPSPLKKDQPNRVTRPEYH